MSNNILHRNCISENNPLGLFNFPTFSPTFFELCGRKTCHTEKCHIRKKVYFLQESPRFCMYPICKIHVRVKKKSLFCKDIIFSTQEILNLLNFLYLRRQNLNLPNKLTFVYSAVLEISHTQKNFYFSAFPIIFLFITAEIILKVSDAKW